MSVLTALFVGAAGGAVLETLAVLLLTGRAIRNGKIVILTKAVSIKLRKEAARDKMIEHLREKTEDGRRKQANA